MFVVLLPEQSQTMGSVYVMDASLSAGIVWKGSNLAGIAQTAAKWGDIVVELGDITVPEFSADAAPTCSPAQVQVNLHISFHPHHVCKVMLFNCQSVPWRVLLISHQSVLRYIFITMKRALLRPLAIIDTG
jgi:hypothetical protein